MNTTQTQRVVHQMRDDQGTVRGQIQSREYRTALQFRWACADCPDAGKWSTSAPVSDLLFDLRWHLDVDCETVAE